MYQAEFIIPFLCETLVNTPSKHVFAGLRSTQKSVFAVPPHLSGFHHDKGVVFSREWANSQHWTVLHKFHVCDNLCGECGHYICSVF